MKQAVSIVAIALALAGCAQQPRKPDMPISEMQPTPVCKGEEQCSRMWARAIDGIQMVTRMRVMTASESFIQTYPTNKIGFMNGQVIKQSVGDGKYAIKASLDCGRYSWCDNMLNRGVSLFNSQVQGFEPQVR